MKVSVITPTADREKLLKGAYDLLQRQTHADWEWLIYDTSLNPTTFSDPRVIYIFDPGIVSIGEKRNRLLERAGGDVIVHFDDDDFYAENYLENCARRLKVADFFTFEGWFSYDAKSRQFFYWDTEEPGEVRYSLDALTGMRVREIDFGPYCGGQMKQLNEKGKKGYGFSFSYTSEVAKACRFEDVDFGEDRYFYEEAGKKGFKLLTSPDRLGEAVHIIHDANTSTEFPQYRLPSFMIRKLIPSLFSYLHTVYEN